MSSYYHKQTPAKSLGCQVTTIIMSSYYHKQTPAKSLGCQVTTIINGCKVKIMSKRDNWKYLFFNKMMDLSVQNQKVS